MKEKVAVIGTNGLPACYGGFETMVNYLTKEKSNEYDFYVYCSKTTKAKRLQSFNNSQLIYLPFNANGFQSIIYDILSISLSWFKHDTLLIFGTSGSLIIPFLKLFKKTRTVINFGGLEWKREKWSAIVRMYLKFSEAVAIKSADIIVADNQVLCGYIKKEYKKDSVLIEYGGDHTAHRLISPELISQYPFLAGEYAISVSRAQPDNNLRLLLEAYSKTPDKNLVLISNWDKFDYGIKLKKQSSDYSNLYLLDAIYDLNILDVLRGNAKLYIHSHTYCGTSPSLVEAMSLELPIAAYAVPTNFVTTENKALYFSNQEELRRIVQNTTEQELKNVGKQMKEIAQRRYTWKRITNEYAKLFTS